ncbi:hypothetical protein [Actinomadura sp. KC06]|uniref:hypothetical protein n=1 Tax=Actinomadura sp. KC06 TaxID=2530369 RepID=UPI001A9CF97E|nr:hypothetical protein [Actinomadura sp. KC06]
MQYLVNVIGSRNNSGTAEEAVATDASNDRLRDGGHGVFAAGLADPAISTVVDGRGDEPVATDGPDHALDPRVARRLQGVTIQVFRPAGMPAACAD